MDIETKEIREAPSTEIKDADVKSGIRIPVYRRADGTVVGGGGGPLRDAQAKYEEQHES